MFEVGAVVVSGGEQHDRRVVDAVLRDRAQRFEQQVGIVVDGTDALLREELGEEPHHHLAVLEHVRHARGRAQVVLEHVVRAVLVAHEIDAGDMRIHAVWQLEAEHRDLVGLVGEHLLGGHYARLENFLLVINVVQEAVQRVGALAQAARELIPLGARNDARDGVERNQALGTGVVAVDGEGDADAVEQQIGFAALLGHALGRRFGEPFGERAKMRADITIRAVHLVVVPAFHPVPFSGNAKQPLCRGGRGRD